MFKKIILLTALITLSCEIGEIGEINAQGNNMRQMKITVNGRELTATLEDNVTTRALIGMLPMTLPMMDLFIWKGNVLSFRQRFAYR